MSPDTLQGMRDFTKPMAEVARWRDAHGPEYGNYLMHWFDEYDLGIRGQSWFEPAFDDHAWKTVHVPGGFADFGVGEVPAVVWFRKEITLPDPLPAGAAILHLGVVEKMDTSYINGR